MSYKKYLESFGKKKVKKYANGGDTEDPIKPSRDWLSNWFKNRKTTDEEVNKFLIENRDEIIKRINNVPVNGVSYVHNDKGDLVLDIEELDDNSAEDLRNFDKNGNETESAYRKRMAKEKAKPTNVLGMYNPFYNRIDYLDNLSGDSSVLTHELTHAGMNDLYSDYMNNIVKDNIVPITRVSDETKSLVYDNAVYDLKNMMTSAKLNKQEDEINDYLLDYPEAYLRTRVLADNKRGWAGVLDAMASGGDLSGSRQIIPKTEFMKRNFNDKKTLEYYNNYVSQPDELHARIMEIRKELGVKPNQVIDAEFILNNRDKLDSSDAYLQLRDILKQGDKTLIDLMNKMADTNTRSNRFSQYLNTMKNV